MFEFRISTIFLNFKVYILILIRYYTVFFQEIEDLELSSGGIPISGYPRCLQIDSDLCDINVEAHSLSTWCLNETDLHRTVIISLYMLP